MGLQRRNVLEEKDQFDRSLRQVLEKYKRKSLVLIGDMNATMQLGSDKVRVMRSNDNGRRLEDIVLDFQLQLQNWRWQSPTEAWT